MVVDPALPGFIPGRPIFLKKFFFTFNRPGGNKIEPARLSKTRASER